MNCILDTQRSRPPIRLSLALALLAAAGGCQSYQPSPVDLSAHRAAFLARLPDAGEVAAMRDSLAETSRSSTPVDLTNGLSLDEAELVALVLNADLRTARLKAGVAGSSALHAGLWDDPTIGIDLTRIIESVQNPWKLAASIGLTIPISGRLELEKQRATLAHQATLTQVAEQEWRVRMDVRRAWLRWASSEAQLTAMREFVGRIDAVLEIVSALESAGEMARTEARLFKIERASRRSELAMLELETRSALLEIRQLLGLPPASTMVLTPGGMSVGPMPAPVQQTLAERNLLIHVAQAQYEVAERELEVEVRKQYPDLGIAPGYGLDDGQDEVLLGLSIPIPVFNANRQGIAVARAQRELARAELEQTLERVLQQIQLSTVRYEAAKEQRELLEMELLPLVDGQYADSRKLVELGEISGLLLLESLSRQQAANVRVIDVRRQEGLAAIELQALAGPERITAGAKP